MKKMIHNLASKGRIALLAGALVIAGTTAAFSRLSDEETAPAVRLVVDQTPIERNGKFTTSFAPVVKNVSQSVVQINVSSKPKNAAPNMPFNDPFFRRFFGEEFENHQRGSAPKQHGLGSGVIVTKDGYILTNNHVVENADDIKVKLNDGREFKAKTIGTDPKTDIAILKIESSSGESLPFLSLANSDNIQIGDVVLAIGNPFGIGQTVTMGIISATGRGNMGMDYEDFIQTDAAINPGNSGGALVDAQGRLIGINTAILSRTGANHGIGFAIPVNLARSVMESLVTDGRVVRGYIGVTIQDMTPALAQQFGVKEREGALISEVSPNSPAEKGGLKSGDVIVEFNRKAIRDSRHLKLQVSQTKPGQKVPVKVMRDGDEKSLSVTLKELPGSKIAGKSNGDNGSANDLLDGVTVGDLNPASRSQLNLPKNVEGALVMNVEPGSASHEAGLRQGDVILELNRQKVENAEHAVELSEKTHKGNVLLKIWSQGGSRYLLVENTQSSDKVG